MKIRISILVFCLIGSLVQLSAAAQEPPKEPPAADPAAAPVESTPESEGQSPSQAKSYLPEVVLPDETARLQTIADELEKLFGHKFNILANERYGVIYDTEITFARQTVNLLDFAYEEFYNVMSRQGIIPNAPKERFICILLKEHSEYKKYSEATGSGDPGASAGYYAPHTNRITFYDARTSDDFKQITGRLTSMAEETKNIREEARLGKDNGKERAARMEQINKEKRFLENKLKQFSDGNNISTTTHEAVHQIAFNTGVQNNDVENPIWLSEGMASCFELQQRGAHFGPFKDNEERRGTLVSASNSDGLVPLAEFVAYTRYPNVSREKLVNLYGYAWGLYKYLFTTKKVELAAYMKAVHAGVTDHKATFEEHFGPIDKLEVRFKKFVETQKKLK